MGVIVNTGRRTFELVVGSVWKSREKRGPARFVKIDSFTRTHVAVRTIGSKRLAHIHLQDFVVRFDLQDGGPRPHEAKGASAIYNTRIKKENLP